MHDFAELIFHMIVGLLRALWAVCEFVFQALGEAIGEGLIEAILSKESRRQRVDRSGRPVE